MTESICLCCGQEYQPITKSQKNRPRKYCSTACQRSHHADIVRSSNILKYIQSPKRCLCCDTKISYDQRNNKYCSHSCSAKISNTTRQSLTEEQKENQRSILTKYRPIKKVSYISWCRICGKYLPNMKRVICDSQECKTTMRIDAGRNGGKTSSKIQTRRSKDEIELFNLCSTIFNNISHNTPMFDGWDADILLHDYKIAILWNGPWHYRQLNIKNHSLAQVQNRDRIKQDVFELNGWRVFKFNDNEYTPQSAFIKINDVILNIL